MEPQLTTGESEDVSTIRNRQGWMRLTKLHLYCGISLVVSCAGTKLTVHNNEPLRHRTSVNLTSNVFHLSQGSSSISAALFAHYWRTATRSEIGEMNIKISCWRFLCNVLLLRSDLFLPSGNPSIVIWLIRNCRLPNVTEPKIHIHHFECESFYLNINFLRRIFSAHDIIIFGWAV